MASDVRAFEPRAPRAFSTVTIFRDFILSSSRRLAMPILSYPGANLVGCTVRELVTNPEAQAAVQQALHERYGLSFVMTAMDLSVEAGEFGAPVTLTDAEIPFVSARLVTSEPEIARLPVPRAGAGRTRVYLDTVRRLVARPGAPLVLGGMIGPLSLAARLFGVSETLTETADHPELIHPLLEKVAAFLTDYARAFKAAGAHGLIVAEPTAGIISPRATREFSSAYLRRIIAAVADDRFEVVLHNCGARLVHLPATLEAGAQVCHFGKPMDLLAALTQVPAGTILCGNLDPVGVFAHGEAADVRQRTIELLETTRAHRGFVISSGCDVPPGTPLANLDAFFAAVREFNASPGGAPGR